MLSLGIFCPQVHVVLRNILSQKHFCHWNILSWEHLVPGTFCPWKHLIPVNMLSWKHFVHGNIWSCEHFVLGTCCPQEHVVPRNLLSKGTFCPGQHLFLGTFFSFMNILSPGSFCTHEHFVPCSHHIWRLDIYLRDIGIQSHFVSGTCCPGTFCMPVLYFVAWVFRKHFVSGNILYLWTFSILLHLCSGPLSTEHLSPKILVPWWMSASSI